MFIVLLRFTDDRHRAAALMDAHNAWLHAGFDEGVFMLSGRLEPASGGALLAHGLSRESLQRRLDADPFVAEGIVEADIIQITPGKAESRLHFLLD